MPTYALYPQQLVLHVDVFSDSSEIIHNAMTTLEISLADVDGRTRKSGCRSSRTHLQRRLRSSAISVAIRLEASRAWLRDTNQTCTPSLLALSSTLGQDDGLRAVINTLWNASSSIHDKHHVSYSGE